MRAKLHIHIYISLLFILLVNQTVYSQNLKVSGKKIIDATGNEVILRGMGLGGWMLQEPYMMEMGGIAGTQTQIRAKFESLIGSSNTQAFYDKWLANHCTRKDIDSLAAWGFNSVRLPMHYNLFTLPIESEPVSGSNTWIDKGFVLVDSLIKWCAANKMYVILDLHAAPGGQGRDAAISDYNSANLSLWESETNKQKTIALWRKLAERYVNEPWVGGYDLINEPNWNFVAGANQNGCAETTNSQLRQLYISITNAIREVDTKHIIIIEGNCWGNNYNGVLPAWDQNMVLSFHKYWSYNDQGSIQGIINLRNQYNMPIWLGESGENSNVWFTDAIQLAEKNGIGWAWWPLKKINSVVNPLTIVKTADYQTLLNFWKNGGTQPSTYFASNALMQMAENARLENCKYRKDVIDAMFRQVSDTTTKPFAKHLVPGVIPATDYDLGRNGQAYYDTDIADYHVSNGTYTSWNNGYSYRNDGVDIESSSDFSASSNKFNVGWTADNEWLQYTVNVDSSAAYNVQVRYATSSTGSKIKLKANDADISGSLMLTSTSGYQTWSDLTINDVVLYKGINKLKVVFEKGGANFGFLGFTLSKKIDEVILKPTSAETHLLSQFIYADFNKKLDGSTVKADGFSCTVNGNVVSISNLSINSSNPFQIILSLGQQIFDIDDINLNYTGGQVKSVDGSSLGTFSNLQVKNNLPINLVIPGKIEAEAFTINQGLQLETTTDAGGGQNIGYTNTGDYLDYRIRVTKSAKYSIEIRVASAGTAGTISIQQLNTSGAILNYITVSIPVTGGWQTWRSISAEMNLTEGISTMHVAILQPEFNINWFKFTEKITGIANNSENVFSLYPNPAHDGLTVNILGAVAQSKTLSIRASNGIIAKMLKLSTIDEIGNFYVGDLPKGLYIVELEMAGRIFRNKLIII